MPSGEQIEAPKPTAAADLSVALARAAQPIEHREHRSRLHPALECLLLATSILAGCAVWVAAIARYAADDQVVVDLTRHASLHLWIPSMLMLCVAAFVAARRLSSAPRLWWVVIALMLPPWMLVTAIVRPWQLLPLATNRPDGSADRVRVLTWNVLFSNPLHGRIARELERSDADIVAILECSGWLLERLEPLRAGYRYSSLDIGGQSHGVVVFSRVPDTQMRLVEIDGRVAVELRFRTPEDGREHSMLFAHPASPRLPPHGLQHRDTQLKSLAQWAAANADRPAVIAGDLNVTAYSPAFEELLDQGELVDSRAYRGHFASWPASLGDFGIAIDHALVNRHVKLVYRGVIAQTAGSDHRGIIFEIE